jgi:hypothetical protein
MGLPFPPTPGQNPAPAAGAGPVTLDGTAYGPGLLADSTKVSGNAVPVRIACQSGGHARLAAGAVTASASYSCRAGKSTIGFKLRKADARRLARSTTTAHLTLGQGSQAVRLTLYIGSAGPAASYWTSAYGLRCPASTADPSTLLIAPNFSAAPPTTVDVRPWLAWYTPATGWQWLGTLGPNHSAWYRWTATPNGVAEWQQPGAGPWTWGPISVAPGHGTYLVAVLEAVYWYTHPNVVWSYAHSEPDPSSTSDTSTYCAYP